MPIFRHGSSVVNLPEGETFDCIASKQTAEWNLCKGMEEGKLYTISCEKGVLVARQKEC